MSIRRQPIHSEPDKSSCVVFERPGAPIVCGLSVFCGSRFDPIGKSGLTHFTEHMLVSGSRELPTKTALAMFIERLGGQMGAYTDYESLTLQVGVGDPDDLEKALYLLGQMFHQPLLAADAIESERGAILSELSAKKSKPHEMVLVNLHALMYQNVPLGRMVLGTKEEITQITQHDIREYLEKQIYTSPAVLVVAGDTTQKEVAELLDTHLYLPQFASRENNIFKIPMQQNHKIIQTYPSMEEVAVAIGYHAPHITSKDSAALLLLSVLLGGGRSGLLTRRLRYRDGLVYTVNAEYHPGSDTGKFVIRTSTQIHNLQHVLRALSEEIHNILSGDLQYDDFTFAKEKCIKSRMMNMETSRSWVHQHLFGLLCDPSYSVVKLDQQVKATTIEEMRAVAETYLLPGNAYFSFAGGITEPPD